MFLQSHVQEKLIDGGSMEKNAYRARQILNRQLANPTGLAAVADQLNISYHTLRKQFPRVEGVPMKVYLQSQRIRIA